MTHKEQYPTPASDEPVYEIDSFELLWEMHKGKIIAAAIAIVVAFIAVFGWLAYSSAQQSAAEQAFGAAKTDADYQAVIEKFSSSPVAGNAALLLAKSLRDAKKYDEANAVLDRFIKSQPAHPFAPLAKVAAAENLALAGKYPEAEKALDAVSQTDGKSFAAPFALLMEAEMKAAQGQRDGALRAYRELAKNYPSSVAARVSGQTAEALEAMSAAPVPAVAATPAP